MWVLPSAILYLACVQGHLLHQPNNPYPTAINNDRTKLPYFYYPELTSAPAPITSFNYGPVRQNPDYSAVPPSFNYPAQRQPQYIEDPYYNVPPYTKMDKQGSMYYNPNSYNLRESQSQPKSSLFGPEVNPFDLDNNNNDPDKDLDPKSYMERQSYFEDLELVENFGNYLKKQTQLDESSTTLNDAAHQYNAILSVLIALARAIRNSCADFDQVYDQVYLSTVDTYYKYGLTNADKVAVMIEDYIRNGKSHMPKIMKLKQEICDKELFCSVSVNNKIKASPLLYVKELETLEALSHLARSYYPYIEEFNQAAKKGSVLPYLQNSKDRLREYVMHIVNSVEHLTDKAIRCA